jgi:recombination protein RecA
VKLEEILAGLDPKTRNRFIAASTRTLDYIPTASLGLNLALGGGIPHGRETTIYGNKSSGKSSLMLQTIGIAQAAGKVCALLDVERTFDVNWAQRLGVNTDELIYSDNTSMNHVINSIVALLETHEVDLIVVDSLTALVPAIYFDDKKDELKAFENTGQIGSLARDLSGAMRMVNFANTGTAVVFISQTRTNIGGLYASQTFTGGQAIKFYSSVIVKLFSSESDNKALKRKVSVGDRIIEQNMGRDVDWLIEFSKISPPGQRGIYPFYYRGDRLGLDPVGESVQLADSLGCFQRAGSWYAIPTSVEGERVQGIAGVVRYYNDSTIEFEQLEALIRAKYV